MKKLIVILFLIGAGVVLLPYLSYFFVDAQFAKVSDPMLVDLGEFEEKVFYYKKAQVEKSESGWHSGIEGGQKIFRYYVMLNDYIDVALNEDCSIDCIIPAYE